MEVITYDRFFYVTHHNNIIYMYIHRMDDYCNVYQMRYASCEA